MNYPIAIKVDTKIPCIFNKIRQGSTFLSIKEYVNNFGEVSNFGIIFHFDYINAVKKSVNIWGSIGNLSNKNEEIARIDLINSYSDTLKYGFNHRAKSAHAYCQVLDADGLVINGVKFHSQNKELHLSGLIFNKKILKEGNYSMAIPGNIERQYLMSKTPLAKYRQFKLIDGRFKSITVDSIKLSTKDLHQRI